MELGRDGLSKNVRQIGAYLDDTKFWDMGTPERLSKLTEFLKSEGV